MFRQSPGRHAGRTVRQAQDEAASSLAILSIGFVTASPEAWTAFRDWAARMKDTRAADLPRHPGQTGAMLANLLERLNP